MPVLTAVANWAELAAMLPPCPECGEPFGVLGVPSATDQAACVALHNEVVASRDPARIAAQQAIMATQFPCNSCISKSDDERRRDAERNRIKRAKAWSYSKGQMPDVAIGHRFEDSRPNIEEMNDASWQMLHNWRGASSLWMCGFKGTGKTFGAHCVMNAAIDRGMRCCEVSAFVLSRDAVRFDANERMACCVEADILLIDDIDKVEIQPKTAELLWWIADQRWQKSRRTLLTANWERKTVSKEWTEKLKNEALVYSFFDRLLPLELCRFVGRSQRFEDSQQQQEMIA